MLKEKPTSTTGPAISTREHQLPVEEIRGWGPTGGMLCLPLLCFSDFNSFNQLCDLRILLRSVSLFCCLVAKLCLTLLRPHGLQPIRFFCPWDFSPQEYWNGLPFLLQGIFLTQGSNPQLLCLLHCRQILYTADPIRKPKGGRATTKLKLCSTAD